MQNTLEKYLHTLDVSIEEFYREVREAQEEAADDKYISTFIDCLLASADYDSFYRVMYKEGAKSLLRRMRDNAPSSGGKKQLPAAVVSYDADAKSEGKQAEAGPSRSGTKEEYSDDKPQDKYAHK